MTVPFIAKYHLEFLLVIPDILRLIHGCRTFFVGERIAYFV